MKKKEDEKREGKGNSSKKINITGGGESRV